MTILFTFPSTYDDGISTNKTIETMGANYLLITKWLFKVVVLTYTPISNISIMYSLSVKKHTFANHSSMCQMYVVWMSQVCIRAQKNQAWIFSPGSFSLSSLSQPNSSYLPVLQGPAQVPQEAFLITRFFTSLLSLTSQGRPSHLFTNHEVYLVFLGSIP